MAIRGTKTARPHTSTLGLKRCRGQGRRDQGVCAGHRSRRLGRAVAYRVDGAHLYADILNLREMLRVTGAEGVTAARGAFAS